MRDDCYSCTQESRSDLPVRESVWRQGGWRVALSFNSSLRGWAVVLPTRHVESLAELTHEESVDLGTLLRNVSIALSVVTACAKTYVLLLAEAEGFSHLHFHVVPRMADLEESRRGVNIFAYLKEEPLSDDLLDEIAVVLRTSMERLNQN